MDLKGSFLVEVPQKKVMKDFILKFGGSFCFFWDNFGLFSVAFKTVSFRGVRSEGNYTLAILLGSE